LTIREYCHLYEKRVEYLPENAVDEDPNTRWVADTSDAIPVLTVDLGGIKRFNEVVIMEPYEAHIKSFEFQIRIGEKWKTLVSGTGIGQEFVKQFPSAEARMVRLVITGYRTGRNPYNVLSFPGVPPPVEGVTLSEFQIYDSRM
jgi:hypothetical protein